MSAVAINRGTLPWDISTEDEVLLRRLAAIFLAIVLLITLLCVFINIPERVKPVEEVPENIVRLILEKQKRPPPPPKPEPKPIEKPKPIETPKPKPIEKPKPKPVERVIPVPDPTPAPPSAKEQAVSAISVFDELNDLRDDNVRASIDNDINANAGSEAGSNERSLITSNAGRASGGINNAEYSRGTGGGGSLDGNTGSSRVSSNIGGGGGGSKKSAGSGGGSDRKFKRSEEEVQIVFDRNRGGFDRTYARALRDDPALQGKVVFRLTIEPNGSVSNCTVVSSELGNPGLERKLVIKVKQLKFQAKDVLTTTVNYPIDFFPS